MKRQLLSLSLLVVLLVSFGALFPQTAAATDADNLTFQINHNYAHGGSGTLSAVQSGNTVTVTGKVINAKKQLVLNIDSGVKVVWKAELSGPVNGLMNLSGSAKGTFELAEGGYLSSSEPVTIYNPYNSDCSIIINGGQVENTATDGYAIRTDAVNANVTVNNGYISSSGSGIYLMGTTSYVTVNNGTVTAKRDAIVVRGANSVVNVNGGTVLSTDIAVGSGIYIASQASDAKVNVSGGKVNAIGEESNHAICSDGTYSWIELSGGTIESKGSYATVYMRGSDPTVIVSGTAKVENTGPGDVISGSGMEVSVKGGTVSARSGLAVQTGGAGSVEVSNGFVFAFGSSNAIIPNVIQMDFNAQPHISGDAVVCVLSNPGGKPVFTEGTSTKLTANSGSAVVWAQKGSEAGISYQKGNNKGFFAIGGVTLVAAETISTISTEATAKVTISPSSEASPETSDETRSSVDSSPASATTSLQSADETESQVKDVTITTKESNISGSNPGKSKNIPVLIRIALVALALLLIVAVIIILLMRKKQ